MRRQLLPVDRLGNDLLEHQTASEEHVIWDSLSSGGTLPTILLYVSIKQRHVRHIGRVFVAAEGSARLGGSFHDLRLRLDADEDTLVERVRIVHILKDQLVWLQGPENTVRACAENAWQPDAQCNAMSALSGSQPATWRP